MPAKNDITGSIIKSKPANNAFRIGWDRIFKETNHENVGVSSDQIDKHQSVQQSNFSNSTDMSIK